MVMPAPPGNTISFLKKHPGTAVEVLPGWRRTQSVLPVTVLRAGLFPEGDTTLNIGEVTATE
jgi:hypothetical protein